MDDPLLPALSVFAFLYRSSPPRSSLASPLPLPLFCVRPPAPFPAPPPPPPPLSRRRRPPTSTASGTTYRRLRSRALQVAFAPCPPSRIQNSDSVQSLLACCCCSAANGLSLPFSAASVARADAELSSCRLTVVTARRVRDAASATIGELESSAANDLDGIIGVLGHQAASPGRRRVLSRHPQRAPLIRKRRPPAVDLLDLLSRSAPPPSRSRCLLALPPRQRAATTHKTDNFVSASSPEMSRAESRGLRANSTAVRARA